jgi:glycosyltransferase involved in cell wall biosynthesis
MARMGGRSCATNGRFLTQRMTGVQRYAHEIVAALDEILSDWGDLKCSPELRLVLPPGVAAEPALAKIGLTGNHDLRATMAAQSRKRAALFSWKRSAQLYLDETFRLLGRCVKSG